MSRIIIEMHIDPILKRTPLANLMNSVEDILWNLTPFKIGLKFVEFTKLILEVFLKLRSHSYRSQTSIPMEKCEQNKQTKNHKIRSSYEIRLSINPWNVYWLANQLLSSLEITWNKSFPIFSQDLFQRKIVAKKIESNPMHSTEHYLTDSIKKNDENSVHKNALRVVNKLFHCSNRWKEYKQQKTKLVKKKI